MKDGNRMSCPRLDAALRLFVEASSRQFFKRRFLAASNAPPQVRSSRRCIVGFFGSGPTHISAAPRTHRMNGRTCFADHVACNLRLRQHDLHPNAAANFSQQSGSDEATNDSRSSVGRNAEAITQPFDRHDCCPYMDNFVHNTASDGRTLGVETTFGIDVVEQRQVECRVVSDLGPRPSPLSRQQTKAVRAFRSVRNDGT